MKKIGLICLALILALGSLGAAFAMWTDTITISGPVTTGEVCYGFIDWFVISDPCDPPTGDATCDPGFGNRRPVPENKNVGCATATRIDQHTVEVILDTTYPCYFATVSLHTENCGTIPIKVGECVLTYYIDSTPHTIALPDGEVVYIQGHDQYGGISNVIELMWVNGTGLQLDPGQEQEDSFHIHVLQPAKQSSSYTFTITRTGVQWNEYEP